jgi:hypothetical protein
VEAGRGGLDLRVGRFFAHPYIYIGDTWICLGKEAIGGE